MIAFAAFIVAMAYLVMASLTRRTAPAYAASPLARVRAADWERAGDTLTIDASDGDHWTYVSLSSGRVLTMPDTAGWELAIQRYRINTAGVVVDLGSGSFEQAGERASGLGWATMPGDSPPRMPLGHWYRYNMLTHLLEPRDNVYAITFPATMRGWKVAVLSYYCPGLVAGCLTIRYAPLSPPASSQVR